MAELPARDQGGSRDLLGPAALMVGARVASMAMGILTIPFLIHYLGSTGFAAWALLLALAAGFSLLDIGALNIVVRFLAEPAAAHRWHQARATLGLVWIMLAAMYMVGLIVILAVSGPLSVWLRLPDTALVSPREAVCAVFVAVALKAFFETGTRALYAARQFRVVALMALLQSMLSNLAAIITAWESKRLDLTLLAYWSVQLTVLAVLCFLFRRQCLPHLSMAAFNFGQMREMAAYGLRSQLDQWAQFINFQFDKLIIAGWVGLWAVAPYEVANRSALALRSVPASGLETTLPGAVLVQADRTAALRWYFASTRMTVYAVCVFMLAPLAIAPVFLYAWTGELGYVGRWVFLALIVGAAAGVLTLPAAILAQASGRADFPARSAALSILFNVPLSLALVLQWGLAGAAIGTGIALMLSSLHLLRAVHAHFGWRITATLRTMLHLWPPIVVCVCFGALSYWMFSEWITTVEASVRYARATRIGPGLLALLMYGLCLASLLFVELARGAFTQEERSWLTRAVPFKWFARLARRSGS